MRKLQKNHERDGGRKEKKKIGTRQEGEKTIGKKKRNGDRKREGSTYLESPDDQRRCADNWGKSER